jgi:phage terminase large subunit-like protein
LIPGARIEYITVADYCLDLAKANGWRIVEICLDPWGAAQITKYLEDKGYKVVEIIQGIKTLSEPTKNFREEVYAGNVVHDGNPVLSWAISNAIAEEVDRNKNIILNKKKSRQRIDPIAAIINAHVRAMVGGDDSIYNRRGILSLAD